MEQQRTNKKARLEEKDDDNLKRRRQDALNGIKKGSVYLKDLPEELRDDAEIALAAIRRDASGNGIYYVSDRLKGNKEFVLAAVKVKGRFLKHATEELRGDFEVVLAAVQQNGKALYYASEELRGHCEIVLEAVKQNGRALKFASEKLRGDREIVLAAVRERGYALQFASEELRGDRKVVLEAVRQRGKALWFASELRADREIVLAALDSSSSKEEVANVLLPFVSRGIQNDPMVAAAIVRNGGCLRRGSEIMEQLENVLLAVRALPDAFFVKNLVVDEESVVEFSRQWERWVWHKIWIALELEHPGMQGTGRLLVELSGLPLELRQAKELRRCATVVAAVLSSSSNHENWKDIRSYPQRDD